MNVRFGTLTVSLALAAVVAAGTLQVDTALAYPTPAPVPTRWELEFAPGDLRTYVDRTTGEAYWYFTYKVVNNTGADRFWAPKFTLFTDAGDILDSGQNVSPAMERLLVEIAGNRYTQRQNQVIGKILVGEHNAIDGLVVWPAGRTSITEVTLFVGGISGETTEVVLPISGDREILQKTLERRYLVPGDPLARGDTPVEVTAQRWVMR